MWKSVLLACLVAGASARWVWVDKPTGVEISRKTSMVEELNREFAKLREGCFKRPSGGCDCNVEREDGTTGVETFEEDEECYKEGLDSSSSSSSSSSSQESSSSSEDSTESDSASAEMEKDEAALEAMVKGAEESTATLSRRRRSGKTGVLPPGQLDSSEDDDDDDDDKRVRRDLDSSEDGDDNDSPDDDDKRVIRRHRRDRGTQAAVRPATVGGNADAAKRAGQQTATARANYAKVVQQLKKKFKDLREGCWPLAKGCKCTVDLNGNSLPTNDRGEVEPKDQLKYKTAAEVHKCYTTGQAPDMSSRRRRRRF